MPSQHRPMSRRRLVAALALAPLAAVALRTGRSTAAEPIAEGAQALVQAFAGEGVLLLEDRSATLASRAERFRGLLDTYFATDAIARWVLGRHWGQFDAQQQREYRALFEDLVVYGYVKRFGEYTGERLRITRSLADSPTQATVFSEIDRPAGGQPVRVDWRVGGRDGLYKITDVVVENVSLSQTWRSDFSSVIQQGGGPETLLRTLRERTGQLKAELGVSR
jgi:phospholipid transport system substrate-binding protein